MADIKLKLSGLENIEYFSDGCAAQYKNRKNFMNLCMHEQDFGVKASRTFFPTSHGKQPCDGIGGTVKRLVSKASLQRSLKDQILDPKAMFHFCKKNVNEIIFFSLIKMTLHSPVKCWKAGLKAQWQFLEQDCFINMMY